MEAVKKEECLQYITSNVMYTPLNMDKETGLKKKREFTLEVLDTDIFPHCKNKEQKISQSEEPNKQP